MYLIYWYDCYFECGEGPAVPASVQLTGTTSTQRKAYEAFSRACLLPTRIHVHPSASGPHSQSRLAEDVHMARIGVLSTAAQGGRSVELRAVKSGYGWACGERLRAVWA